MRSDLVSLSSEPRRLERFAHRPIGMNGAVRRSRVSGRNVASRVPGLIPFAGAARGQPRRARADRGDGSTDRERARAWWGTRNFRGGPNDLVRRALRFQTVRDAALATGLSLSQVRRLARSHPLRDVQSTPAGLGQRQCDYVRNREALAVTPRPQRALLASLLDALEVDAAEAFGLLLDFERRSATWRRARYDPGAGTRAGARTRPRLGAP